MPDNPRDLVSIGEVTIPFYEDNLIVQLGEDGEIYVALRPIVQALGLSWGSQLNRIKRDAVLSKKMQTLSVFVTNTQGEGDGQNREVVCLPKQYISGFLFGISAGRIKDQQLRAKVIQFQEEAHLFLDAAFTGDAESALEAMRQKYLRQGYDEAWIKQRQITIETRNQLTDEWKARSVQGKQYGILTAVIHRHHTGRTRQHTRNRLQGHFGQHARGGTNSTGNAFCPLLLDRITPRQTDGMACLRHRLTQRNPVRFRPALFIACGAVQEYQ